MTRFWGKLRMLAAAWVVMIACTFAVDTALIEPHSLIVDRSSPRAQVDSQVIAARRYDTFWNTQKGFTFVRQASFFECDFSEKELPDPLASHQGNRDRASARRGRTVQL